MKFTVQVAAQYFQNFHAQISRQGKIGRATLRRAKTLIRSLGPKDSLTGQVTAKTAIHLL
jgi:hypothetical protein